MRYTGKGLCERERAAEVELCVEKVVMREKGDLGEGVKVIYILSTRELKGNNCIRAHTV